jgi:hypothetical protein
MRQSLQNKDPWTIPCRHTLNIQIGMRVQFVLYGVHEPVLSGGDSLSVPQHDGGDGVVLPRDGEASCRHRLSKPAQHQFHRTLQLAHEKTR